MKLKPLFLILGSLVTLLLLAGRSLGDLIGLCRASAKVAVDAGMDQVPTVIVDRKLDQDIQAQRRQLTDTQVALTLSRRDIEGLEAQLSQLEDRAARRKRLLTEACPLLEVATKEGRPDVQFAGTTYALPDFTGYLDQLLSEQEHEGRQIEIRRTGLAKLKAGMGGGATAVAEMRNALLALENEVELLRARRSQAELEERTLQVVAAVQAAPVGQSDSAVSEETQRLRDHVNRIEAANEAVRGTMTTVTSSNTIARDWERLERLKTVIGDTSRPSSVEGSPRRTDPR